ncbi:MAG: sulfatase, partial [Limisphaerales bacterium]
FDHITSDTQGKLFLGELHNLDKQIGRLVQAVDGLGLGTNTLFVVVGDNGAPNDALKTLLDRNGGLRGGKGNLYEGGIRVPFIIRMPGTVSAGVVNSTTAVSTLDLLPTYCALAGLPLPNAPFAGEDMSDVFRGSNRMRARPLHWEYGTVSGLNPASPKLAIRDGNLKFARNPDGTQRQLFMIPQDHAEATNLVNQSAYSGLIQNLETQLMNWYEEIVLGNVGEVYPCNGNSFTGVVMADGYTVNGGNSPGSGFGANGGVNYQFASRTTGGASDLIGYRLGATGGTSPRQASDFSISNNRLAVAPRNGNGRFELTADGTSGFNFGSFLAGNAYELSVQMNIDAIGATSQRMSLSVSDVSNVAIGDVDLGVQIGSDGTGGLGVFKRIAAGSNSGGNNINTRLTNGLPIGTPINLLLRVSDFNGNTTAYNSSYEVLVNGASVDSGNFGYNSSTSARYLVFDVAGHESQVHYDSLQLTVTTNGGSGAICRKPILNLSDIQATNETVDLRVFWTAQPGLIVTPKVSANLAQWSSLTNQQGNPLTVTTPQGTIQWLQTSIPATNGNSFLRLRRE